MRNPHGTGIRENRGSRLRPLLVTRESEGRTSGYSGDRYSEEEANMNREGGRLSNFWVGMIGLLLACALINLVFETRAKRAEKRHPQRNSTRSQIHEDCERPEDNWQSLIHGDGHNWATLNSEQKKDLCMRAAIALKQDKAVAWTYYQFLESAYRRPDSVTRSQKIDQMIAVCQTMIARGAIEVEYSREPFP